MFKDVGEWEHLHSNRSLLNTNVLQNVLSKGSDEWCIFVFSQKGWLQTEKCLSSLFRFIKSYSS